MQDGGSLSSVRLLRTSAQPMVLASVNIWGRGQSQNVVLACVTDSVHEPSRVFVDSALAGLRTHASLRDVGVGVSVRLFVDLVGRLSMSLKEK